MKKVMKTLVQNGHALDPRQVRMFYLMEKNGMFDIWRKMRI